MAPLWIVEIEDQTYGLPLGWKLSRTTFDIVSWMLGDFDGCKLPEKATAAAEPGDADSDSAENKSDRNGGTGTPQLNEVTLIRNSCVLRTIADLLGDGQVPRQ